MAVRTLLTRVARAAERGDPMPGVAVAALVPLTVAVLFAFTDFGFVRRLELASLDVRFALRSPAEDSRKILQVDIDDDTLHVLPEFPFPRDEHARVIRALDHLGAKLIVFDIEFKHRSAPPERPGRAARYRTDTAEPSPSEYDAVTGEPTVDARELALRRAMRQSGRVVIGYSFAGRDLLSERLRANYAALRRSLESDLSRSAAEIAKDAGLTEREVLDEVKWLRWLVADDLVGEALRPDTPLTLEAACARFLPAGERSDSAVNLLQWALYKRRSEWQVLERSLEAEVAGAAACAVEPFDILPPFHPFAAVVRGTGATNSEADLDGVIRHPTLYFLRGGRPHFYLGLEAAIRALETPELETRVRVRPDAILVDLARKDDGRVERSVVIPTDEQARTLALWRGTAQNPRGFIHETDYKSHLPYLVFTRYYDVRFLKLDQNFRGIILEKTDEESRPGHYREYLELSERLRAEYCETPAPGPEIAPDEARKMEARLEAIRTLILGDIRATLAEAEENLAKPGLRPALREELERDRDYLNANLRALTAPYEQEKELRRLVGGKVCIIGSSSTASGDLHPTPLAAAVPGPDVHANIANMVFTGVFSREAPAALDFLFIVATGVAVAFAVAFWTTWTSILVLLFALGASAGISYAAFAGAAYVLSGAGPPVAAVLTFAAGITFKEVVVRRAQKKLQKELAVHTSPELVEMILRNPELIAKPRRLEATIFFSDVKGFTSLSEGMDSEALVALVNRYLDRMTHILKQRHAYVDKYIGDGIMVLFGVPVESREHAAQACAAALEAQVALRVLNMDLRDAGLPMLSVRIGINSGVVVAGYMGARDRSDYTVMGDAVNLASRLEGANKNYGTGIMVSEITRRLAGDSFLYRELDHVRVVGKKQAVRVYELVARAETTVPFPEGFLGAFDEAMSLFHDRRWEDARLGFKKTLQMKADDTPSSVYLRRCEEFLLQPPPPDWEGVFELMSK